MSALGGIGTDIIEIKRIQKAIERHGGRFLERLFTQKEREYCFQYKHPTSHFAGRFAAKEAVAKALGTGFQKEVGWQEIEILNNSDGQPLVYLSTRLRLLFPKAHLFLSISHCDDYATATAILIA